MEANNKAVVKSLSQLLEKGKKLTYGIVQPGNHVPSGIFMIRSQDYSKGWNSADKMYKVSQDIDRPYQRSRVKTGDILLTVVGANIGKIEIVPEWLNNANISRSVSRISIDSTLSDSRYIANYLKYNVPKLIYKNQVGGAQPVFNLKDLEKVKIPLPPLPEQKKIAQILSTWDKGIMSCELLIKSLKQRKKGLMQQLLTGKTRLKGFGGEWKKYQLGDLATNYNLINKDNKVQEVLSCTKYDGLVRSLEYFGRKVYGDDLSKYKVVPSGYFAYATNHIEEGSIGYQDVLDFGLVSPMYTVFKTNDKVDDSFFYKLLKTDKLIYYYQSNMSGSIARRGGLRWNVFETIVVKIPSIEEQQAIAKVLTTADKEITAQENYLAQLQAQKKGLMQQLLTGQKRVKVNN